MRLKITHRTEYRYDQPMGYGLQRLRLTPSDARTQSVLNWSVEVEGAREELRYTDGFGNDTRLLSIDGSSHGVTIVATGELETNNTAGVVGPQRGFMPLWMFNQATPLTEPGAGVKAIAEQIGDGEQLDRMHQLMALVADKVAYQTGVTNAATTAEEALTLGAGVCQDHAHIFISAARVVGFPARYVSGYLMKEGDQAAAHAWAEAHINGLGWVGFDASNRMSPDETYVSLATGRDYRDAAPVAGIRIGQAVETLAVNITVEQ